MPVCRKCENKFPVKKEIDGKVRNLQNRKYCLDCSPFGSGNRKKLEEGGKNRVRGEKYARWQKKARKERKQKLVEMLGGCCEICGYDKCLSALEFHHDGEKSDKSFGIAANGMLAKWSKLVTEAKKCRLLCCRCHREVHEGIVS